MKKLIISSLIFMTSLAFAQGYYTDMSNAEELENPNKYYEYKIVKGDCLWFISDDFYGDPFNWTKIHEANPYIVNPDWIYPNNWLVIPNIFTDENGNPVFRAAVTKLGNESDLDMESGNEEATKDDYLKDESTSEELIAKYGIDSDGDGVIDGVDLDGDGNIDESAGIDVDGDGVVDGYDVNRDGEIDIESGITLTKEMSDAQSVEDEAITTTASTATAAATMESGTEMSSEDKMTVKDSKKHKECEKPCECEKTYCGKPGWKLGLHAGFPLASAPEDESLNVGILLGTPLGVKTGPLYIGLGAGAFTYNYEDIYLGGGLLASLCINELLKLDIPLMFQVHGAGYYVFGEESGPGFGVIGSGSLPMGDSPISLGAYVGIGKYYPGEKDFNWGNVGAVLYYNF